MPKHTQTLHKQTLESTGEQSTLFQVGSRNHANHTAKQEKDLERKMTDTSGLKCLEQFEELPGL